MSQNGMVAGASDIVKSISRSGMSRKWGTPAQQNIRRNLFFNESRCTFRRLSWWISLWEVNDCDGDSYHQGMPVDALQMVNMIGFTVASHVFSAVFFQVGSEKTWISPKTHYQNRKNMEKSCFTIGF